MSITILGDPVKITEQIKKNSVTEMRQNHLFKRIQTILEKDEFGFFNTKVKRDLDRSITSTEGKIKKLIELKMNAIKEGRNLKEKFKVLKNENETLLKGLTKVLSS